MRRWTTGAAVILVAIAAVVGFGYVWHDHLQGVWGPGDRGGERFGRDGGFRPPDGDGPGERFRPPDGDADRGRFEGFGRGAGDRREGGARGGEWFTAEGVKGFAEAGMPMLVFGGLVIGADRLLRARKRRLRNA